MTLININIILKCSNANQIVFSHLPSECIFTELAMNIKRRNLDRNYRSNNNNIITEKHRDLYILV